MKDLQEISSIIHTEEKIDGGPIADIKVGNEVYEIETLFSENHEGSLPRNKLRESFMKYENTSISTINIVLEPITFLRHLKSIKEIQRNFQKWMKETNKKVNFLTINFEEEALVPFNKFNEIYKLTIEQSIKHEQYVKIDKLYSESN